MKRLCRARCLACFWACFWLIGMSIYTAQAKPADFVEFDEFEAKPLDGWEWDKEAASSSGRADESWKSGLAKHAENGSERWWPNQVGCVLRP